MKPLFAWATVDAWDEILKIYHDGEQPQSAAAAGSQKSHSGGYRNAVKIVPAEIREVQMFDGDLPLFQHQGKC